MTFVEVKRAKDYMHTTWFCNRSGSLADHILVTDLTTQPSARVHYNVAATRQYDASIVFNPFEVDPFFRYFRPILDVLLLIN